MVVSFRKRENRRLLQRAWELSLLLSPHVGRDGADEIAPLVLFTKMPGAFPEDEPELKSMIAAADPRFGHAKLTPEQLAERERRMKLPRLQRPR